MIWRKAGERPGESLGAQEIQADVAVRRRGRLQALLAAVCACGVFLGARFTHPRSPTATSALTEQMLAGEWELATVDGNPVGPNADSVVVSQKISFRNGKLHGVTQLRADTAAATVAMPFPDESASEVVSGADGHLVTVMWNGSYRLRADQQMELSIGKLSSFVKISLNAQSHQLCLDHDAILTYKGKALYRPAIHPTGPTVSSIES